jgi:3-deoxy-manno-octulosonate cytidylyltransferase (CMP-KDO synthetase)
MLADIAGVPMVVRVAERARASKATRVIIATDHADIASQAAAHGIEAHMTRADHPSGTDRLSEIVSLLGLDDESLVVNVQGDEPLMDPALINELASVLHASPQAAIATCATPITTSQALFNPNIVKVVLDQSGHAMYFSRAPIPWDRDALAGGERILAPGLPALHHIGMYAYRASFLRCFPALPVGALEQVECLEQLRAMEHGYRITVHVTPTHPGAGVDTPEDLERVRSLFANTSSENKRLG